MSGRRNHSPRHYVSAAFVAEVQERMTTRDWAIIDSLARTRVLTGAQLERLHFADLSPLTRARIRRGVLVRLASWRLLVALGRRIGGVRGGSSGMVWSLDVAGQRLARLREFHGYTNGRLRRPWTPGRMFLQHSLAVSEVLVSVTELSRAETFDLVRFVTEPACWQPNGIGGYLKPDAYLVIENRDVTDYWWLEVDQDTESRPTLRRKLLAYVEFLRRGQRGPDDVVPRVLVTVPTKARRLVLEHVIANLPSSADRLFYVVEHDQASAYLFRALRE